MSLTPMLRQYLEVKKKYPDAFLFFRLGDFYELFFEDAKKGAAILDITLTSRGTTDDNRVPMCGIPYHAAQGYINKLTQENYQVAICEQLEDPSATKGIVRREVTRVIGPGTNLEDDSLPAADNQYIASFVRQDNCFGVAYLELAIGDFQVGEFESWETALNFLNLIKPRELVTTEALLKTKELEQFLASQPKTLLKAFDAWIFDLTASENLLKETFSLFSLEGIGLDTFPLGTRSAGALLYYLRDNLFKNFHHLKLPRPLLTYQHLLLDRHTLKNLELFPDRSKNQKNLTLFDVLNKTKTILGTRLLVQWLKQPLLDPQAIHRRLDTVQMFFENNSLRTRLQQVLMNVRDIEKILGKLTCDLSNPRDLLALKISFRQIPEIKKVLLEFKKENLSHFAEKLQAFPEIVEALEKALVEEPPALLKNGGFVRKGYSAELDALTGVSRGGREWIASFQQQEIDKTGIKSLKVRFNRVFGYYIEITKTNLDMVPAHYERKQTLVNAERFTLPELKEYERKILHADEVSLEIELAIFETLRQLILKSASSIQQTASLIATVDVLASFSQVAHENHYVKPEVVASYELIIEEGRHPVVEKCLADNRFVANNTLFDVNHQALHLITGPNMAGKSTFLRQNALLVLMAQTGSFVPAKKAKIGVVDRIFTRIGASDNLTAGESTFMVEMIETATILHHATPRSLLIMDEVGRGTSTFDGVSIAWAICEFLAEMQTTPKTLFATHYHELAELEKYFSKIKNFNAGVKESSGEITFLRKIAAGPANKSYGIHVAALAGLPGKVVERAREVLRIIESDKEEKEALAEKIHDQKKTGTFDINSLPLFQATPEEHPVLQELRDIQTEHLTPLQALNLLHKLKESAETGKTVSAKNN